MDTGLIGFQFANIADAIVTVTVFVIGGLCAAWMLRGKW